MTANERRMALLEALCLRRHDTRENLAFKFGVSKRTIEYDVQILSVSYPIYSVQGKGGGIFIMEGYELHRKYLTDKQSEYLEELAATSTGESKQIALSILKDFSKRKELRYVRRVNN